MSRFLVFGRIEAGVVGERDLFAAIVIDALCESLHKLFAALTGRSEMTKMGSPLAASSER